MPRYRLALSDLAFASAAAGRFVSDEHTHLELANLRDGSSLEADLDQLRGRAVLLATERQLTTILAALTLDGIASRLYFCPPDLVPHIGTFVDTFQVDVIVSDRQDVGFKRPVIACFDRPVRPAAAVRRDIETEWVLFTSGTSGRPKLVVHLLSSLSGSLDDGLSISQGTVWSTFYDIRRYGGMQILLRALLGSGSLVLSSAAEPIDAFLRRAIGGRVTHISGTPSHWRRALMSSSVAAFSPRYVRLSGETADQSILDRLRGTFPQANVAHAFASTEAGVGFDVRDGLAGFPASFLPHPNGNASVELKIEDGTLRIRSSRTAFGYLGPDELASVDGFIDTGDLVALHGSRYHFMGRREGVINVGGQKVFPEEVEDVLTRHPDVLAARVWPRRSPMTGAIVAADLQLNPSGAGDFDTIRAVLDERCRAVLPAHKVPATWRLVEGIEMTASGKVKRA